MSGSRWHRTGTGLAAAASGLLDLVLPLRCAGCARPGTGWCAECARELGGLRKVVRELPAPPDSTAAPPVFALGRYRGAPRRAVVSYKAAGRRDLADPFGTAIADGLEGLLRWEPDSAGSGSFASMTGPDLAAAGTWHLVPAPSRAITSRRRGGAHMTRVALRSAAVLAERGRAAEVADCLVAAPGARDSVGLAPAERLRNLAGRVAVLPRRAPPAGEPVLLIDDVLTTGATAMSAVHALARHGVPVTAVLVLTATSG
ncbi:ComF family protein [Saccharopolyspora gloriosae]|uniref:Putative amidophosphoribosyltransferase n=1 Tax=Saccharopolyspora gloriosae TaxID=455344 RepID=A0A840NNT5_9PSEU|nr:ComF family protein [Saccharopolyspora gloriosae]MBB5071733.1 putative amidophosphoribosyltransferase [Saccharopolyspora gloriosae]